MTALGGAWPFAEEWLWPVGAAFFGLLAGSLANACIDRLPRDRPFERRLLRCRECGWPERWFDALPIVGWLIQEGRCRRCRAQVPIQRPVVEAVNAVLWLLLAGAHPPSARALASMAFLTSLLVLSLIDLEHQLLPDVITLPGIALGVAATFVRGWPIPLLDAALSAGIGYFGMMILAKAAEMYYREEALGQGDWKMVAMLGAFMGSAKVVWVVLIANVSGALIGLLLVAILGDEGRQRLPLGTFLGAAGILMTFV